MTEYRRLLQAVPDNCPAPQIAPSHADVWLTRLMSAAFHNKSVW